MNKIFHLMRADFLERVRRDSFLLIVGLAVFLGYNTLIGFFRLELGAYRGVYNAAWIGMVMALILTFLAFTWCGAALSGIGKRERGKSLPPRQRAIWRTRWVSLAVICWFCWR